MTHHVYRVGRKLGRTIYRNDRLIGIMDSPVDGHAVVVAMTYAHEYGPRCACGNAGRYVTSTAELTCGICPLKRNQPSIRLADVPDAMTLVQWAARHELDASPLIAVWDLWAAQESTHDPK